LDDVRVEPTASAALARAGYRPARSAGRNRRMEPLADAASARARYRRARRLTNSGVVDKPSRGFGGSVGASPQTHSAPYGNRTRFAPWTVGSRSKRVTRHWRPARGRTGTSCTLSPSQPVSSARVGLATRALGKRRPHPAGRGEKG